MVKQDQNKSIYSVLDKAADVLRSKMDASEYKNYLLGLIFYKYLSDTMLNYVWEYRKDGLIDASELNTKEEFYAAIYHSENHQDDIIEDVQDRFGYVINPEHTFSMMVASINGLDDMPFQLETLKEGFNEIQRSGGETYKDLFDDLDLDSKRLGTTRAKQSELIASVMLILSEVDFGTYTGDVLGNVYEYLIGRFAMQSGKRAGEFYTPHEVSDLMSRLVLHGQSTVDGLSVYDATCGSGSLMLNVEKHIEDESEQKRVRYYGQELNTTTYNLARMNMILHKTVNRHTIRNADTLTQDWPQDEPTNFDTVVMNPPYSAKWSADKSMLTDPRFQDYGVLAPKSKADFAFLLHGFYHLETSGTMAIVLPHGVLFRGNAEGKIRQKLLEDGSIYAVIGLPANIFYNTSIPTTILILKKDRTNKDVLFIDASELYDKEKTQNVMRDKHLDQIVEAFVDRKSVDKFSHLASFDEIKENEFNLNIPRYVDTFEEEEVIDLKDLAQEMIDTQQQINESEKVLAKMMNGLVGTTPEADDELSAFRQLLGMGELDE